MIDVDHFKKINDDYGHVNGDKVLTALSKSLRSNLRKTDSVFRYGGDEFCILLPSTDLNGALRVAQVLNTQVKDIEFVYNDSPISITISLGVTELKKNDHIQDVIARADKALHEAKQAGRDRVTVFKTYYSVQ